MRFSVIWIYPPLSGIGLNHARKMPGVPAACCSRNTENSSKNGSYSLEERCFKTGRMQFLHFYRICIEETTGGKRNTDHETQGSAEDQMGSANTLFRVFRVPGATEMSAVRVLRIFQS